MKKHLSVFQLVLTMRMKISLLLIGAMAAVNLTANFVMIKVSGGQHSLMDAAPVFQLSFLTAYIGLVIHSIWLSTKKGNMKQMIYRIRITDREFFLWDCLAAAMMMLMLLETEIITVGLADWMNRALGNSGFDGTGLIMSLYRIPFFRVLIPLAGNATWGRNIVFALIAGGSCAFIMLSRPKGAPVIGLICIVCIPFAFVAGGDDLVSFFLYGFFDGFIEVVFLIAFLVTLFSRLAIEDIPKVKQLKAEKKAREEKEEKSEQEPEGGA